MMKKAFIGLFVALTLAVALDWFSKIWAEQTLEPYQPVPVIGDFFRLTLGYNTGVAFGMFADGGIGPLIVTGVVIAGLIIWFVRSLQAGRFPPSTGWPIGLLLGGAMANFADRLLDGKVTDFLDVGLAAWRWPTFNLADSFIIIGMAWLVLVNYAQPHQPAESKSPETSPVDDTGFSPN
jgi:signal peptidase II